MPQSIIVFGASGDLAKLKIYPALFELYTQNYLEDDFNLIGYSRTPILDESFKSIVEESIGTKANNLAIDPKSIKKFLDRCSYKSGNYDNLSDLENLFSSIDQSKQNSGEDNSQIICYFSVPPQVFQPLILGLAHFNNKYNLKIVIEKPFGTDEESARLLYSTIVQHFHEDQFYLLDHYLGKSSVRDILTLRQQNSILNHLIKGKHIKSIQISALETLGVDGRLGYFNSVGTIRDMIQSHLLQVLALICMDLPINKASVSREKSHILSSTHFEPDSKNIILGQYEGYTSVDPSVKDSKTETFAIVKLCIDREDWFDTPIYIRTGKKLAKKESKIVIEFDNLISQNPEAPTNKLIIEFSPNESLGMQLSHNFGLIQTSQKISCDGPGCLGDYASLINDVFQGDHLHFVTFEQIIQSWRITDEILKFSRHLNPEIYKINQDPNFQNNIFLDNKNEWY